MKLAPMNYHYLRYPIKKFLDKVERSPFDSIDLYCSAPQLNLFDYTLSTLLELDRDIRSRGLSAMAYIIGDLRDLIRVPFGVNVVKNPIATIDLAAATGAKFGRSCFSGAYMGEYGLYTSSPTVPFLPILWAMSPRRRRPRPVWPPARRWSPAPGIPPRRPSAWAWWNRAPLSSSTAPPCSYYCVDRFVDQFVSPSGNGSLKGGKVFTVPGTFCMGDGTNAAGTLTRWVRDTLYASELAAQEAGGENAYAVMAREAAEVSPGSGGLMMLPYIYGERSPLQDPRAAGMIFGLRGGHDRRHIDRAALEAIGYSTYQHLILFEEMGLPPRRIITAGGGTKNRTWMQIICDMAGLPITIPEPWQCSSYGDAMLAAVGCGALKDFLALRDALPQGTVLRPDPENHSYYKAHYPIFRELYRANRESMYAFRDDS